MRYEARIAELLERILRVLTRIERELLPPAPIPATGVTITQIGLTMLPLAPGNSPTFQAALQPANAGPFVASEIKWSVTGDPGASVAQIASDPTGLTAILTLSSAVAVGASLFLSVQVTNQDGSVVSTTDTLLVVSGSGVTTPGFVPATGVIIQQIA